MTTAVIGATGRVGSEIVGGVLARGDAVTALVRDPGKARRAFGEPGGLHIRPTRLDDPREDPAGLTWILTDGITKQCPFHPANFGATGPREPASQGA
jgi:nucleoside-diphosphate-sugar epimerase